MVKKSVVVAATALLACATGAVWAESSVTIYGLVDQAVGKNIGAADEGILDSTGSRLGFKGEHDLGSGLTGSFQLEQRFSPQSGSSATPFFKGGSWVGLSGGFGKVMIGRQWSEAFLKSEFASDPFGMSTVAGVNFGTVGCGGVGGCVGAFWVDNSVSYEYSAGPVSFGAQVAQTPFPGAKLPFNFGVSYSDGPLYVGFGYEAHESVFSTAGAGFDAQWSHLTVNYDFGAVKLITGFGGGKDNLNNDRRNVVVGLVVPFGASALIAQYNQHDEAGSTVVAQTAVGYQYNLLKGTKLFATVTNDSKAVKNKTGYDLGILFSF